jgi:hypothetical protein
MSIFVSLAGIEPALSCVPETMKIKSYCRNQSTLSRLLSVVWPDTTPYQIAVVAGVARYPNLRKDEQLPPAEYDVETLSTKLRDKMGFNEVIILKDKDFTRDNLRYLFSEYIPSQLQDRKNSQALFAYSGHGADYENAGYLFFSGTVTIDPHSYNDLSNAIDLDELKILMKPTINRATHFLVLLNSCKGGYFIEHASFASYGPSALDARGAHGITAGGRKNNVHALENVGSGKGSVFFEMVFAALDGSGVNLNGVSFADPAATDGILNSIQLATFLSSTVEKVEDYKFGPQIGRLNPRAGDEGYFFFITDEKKASQALRSIFPKNWAKAFGAPPSAAREPPAEITSKSKELQTAGPIAAPQPHGPEMRVPPPAAPTWGRGSLFIGAHCQAEIAIDKTSYYAGVYVHSPSEDTDNKTRIIFDLGRFPTQLLGQSLYKNLTRCRYNLTEGAIAIGSRQFRSRMDLGERDWPYSTTCDQSVTMDLVLFSGEGDVAVRNYLQLLFQNEAAYLTLTKGPLAGQRLTIPLTGLREALQATNSCSSFLPN